MKYLYHLFILVSLGMTIYFWHSMVEERTQIAVALDSRALEAEATHRDYLQMVEITKGIAAQLGQAEKEARTIQDHIMELDDETHLLQKVHQEFLDAWKSSGKVK